MLEYHPRHHYVNDFTIIEDKGLYHLFHITGERLKMSTFLTDLPKQGHAVSTDLVSWRELPFVTNYGGPCSAVRHDGRFAMLGNLQKLMWSEDLNTWSEPSPVHFDFDRADAPYETEWNMELMQYHSHRDPNIHWDPEKGVYVVFFCSRVKPRFESDPYRRGCVGLAESKDLIHWQVKNPALPPGDHLFPESPHVVDIDGVYHMFFTLSPEKGLRHAVSTSLRGPYQEVELRDVLPAYFGASEAVKTGAGWMMMGRLLDRNERCNQSRLSPRTLCLPLSIHAGRRNAVAFRATAALAGLRGPAIFDTRKERIQDRWQVVTGDWRTSAAPTETANGHNRVPPNSVFGSSAGVRAELRFLASVPDFDLECTLHLPTFNGNDIQSGAGILVDGLRFAICTVTKSLICTDHLGSVIAQSPLPDFKLDRNYRFRLFRCDAVTQVFLDGDLLAYLPAYGDASGRIGFVVDHGDLIVSDIAIWSLSVPGQNGLSVDNGPGITWRGTVF